MDKESEVIIEEIESYNDSPAELIFDEFENMIFEGHHIGHDILGSVENIRNYKSENLKKFVKRMYKPQNMVYFVFGEYEFDYVKKVFIKYMSDINLKEEKNRQHRQRKKEKAEYVPKTRRVEKETHQAHVMMGCRAYSSDDKRRVALYFLNNIIGGPGMNSLLNVALREHNGLVYTVESMLTNYTDSSMFSIYFGCDSKDIEKCIRIVRKELHALMEHGISKTKFTASMKQIKGQIGVSCDNFENYALDMAKSYLHYNKFDGIEETFKLLDQLTPKILQEVAQDLFHDDNISILIYS
jgi:predicted Zn-dependent peptidase